MLSCLSCHFQRRKAEIQAQVDIIKKGENRCVNNVLGIRLCCSSRENHRVKGS